MESVEEIFVTLKREGKPIPLIVREGVILKHLGLVASVMDRIRRRIPSHVDFDDLYNQGVIGLMDALDKYDPRKEAKLKTYAEFRVKGAILDMLRGYDWVPRSTRQKIKRIEGGVTNLRQNLGREPESEEIADCLGITLEHYNKLMLEMSVAGRYISLDPSPLPEEEGRSLHEVIPDLLAVDPLQAYQAEEDMGRIEKEVKEALAKLTLSERTVMLLTYFSDLTLEEIGEILGVVESRACQIMTSATKKLRRTLSGVARLR